jgi:hypothetical protein
MTMASARRFKAISDIMMNASSKAAPASTCQRRVLRINNFGMPDNNPRWIRLSTDGIKLVVDEVSLDYLHGARIDFVNDPERGAGFLVDSPVARAHAESHGEEGCACGGSCACNS